MADKITKNFLEGILKSKVKSLELGAGTNLGDNFYSILHSIKIILENESDPKYLLLKAYPLHPARQEFLNATNVFEKELFVYTKYIPALTSFIQQTVSNKDDKKELELPFAPLIHGLCKESEDEEELSKYLLMVDLRKTYGFKMADRYECLDFEHCEVMMRALAKIHAVGWCYQITKKFKNFPDEFPFIKDTVICSGTKPLLDTWNEARFSLMTPFVEKNLGAESPAAIGFQRHRKDATKITLDYLENVSSEKEKNELLRIKQNQKDVLDVSWKVACHGDCWTNNLLFRYDENSKPVEVKLVDLQMLRETCPTTDLALFFYTSTTYALRSKHLDNLLTIYAEEFLNVCKILKLDPLPGFSVEEVIKRFQRAKPFSLLIATLYMPNVLQPLECAEDLDKVDTAEGKDMADMYEAIDRKLSDNPLISERIVEIVKEMYEGGVI